MKFSFSILLAICAFGPLLAAQNRPPVLAAPTPPFTVPDGYQVHYVGGGAFLVVPDHRTDLPPRSVGLIPATPALPATLAAPPVLPPTATAPPAPELPANFNSADYAKYIAVIEGDAGSGTGFIANYLDKPFLFTNTHVISGNAHLRAHSLDGRPIKLGGLAVAESYDLSLFQQSTVPKGLDLIKNADAEVNIGDEVVVLGNSLGGGVITALPGKVTGIGPDLIEVDAKFVEGNSGSPVIQLKSGKVIGVATFAIIRQLDGIGKDSTFNNVERRFAYRVDNVPTWRNTTSDVFYRESSVVSRIEDRTKDVWDLSVDIARNNKITQWGVFLAPTNSIHQYVSDYQQVISDPGRSGQEILAAKQSLFRWLTWALTQDLEHLNDTGYVDYDRKKVEQLKQERDEIKGFLEMTTPLLSDRPDNFWGVVQ